MKHPERSPISASGLPVRRLLVWAVLAVPLAGAPFQDARAGCREAMQQMQEALRARDLDATRRHYETVWKAFDCSGEDLLRAGRAVSNLHVHVAEERIKVGASLASQRGLLEQGNAYGRNWRALALLGDVAHEERDFDRSAGLYQEALAVLDNERYTPKPPPPSDIKRILHRAGLDRAAAKGYVRAPIHRGRLTGLAASTIRGVKVERVPIPITFRTALWEFDEKGRLYAEEMATFLIQQSPERITLSAHTDERGGDAQNLKLSQQRGEAVRKFLIGRGFKGEIVMIPKGESDPLELPNPQDYSQEERWRMNRRVELMR